MQGIHSLRKLKTKDPYKYNFNTVVEKHEDNKIFPELSTSPSSKPNLPLKNVFCVNCGEKGHVVKECVNPITSFGIIAFKVINEKFDEVFDKNEYLVQILNDSGYVPDETGKDFLKRYKQNTTKIKFLMIQRKDTMGFIDFIRGKYSMTDHNDKMNKIRVCLNEMTLQEKNALLTKNFDQLWSDLWINKNSRVFQNEYAAAKEKFNLLNIKELVNGATTLYTFNEWGFPKGRRNMKETNLMCAEREFYEETGYDKSNYDFIKDYPMIKEEFMGTNGVKYRHIYYLVKMKNNTRPPKVDHTNTLQMGEIKNIGWLTLNESLHLIRPYDVAKKHVIKKVHEDILKMKNNYNCSRYYTLPMKNLEHHLNMTRQSSNKHVEKHIEPIVQVHLETDVDTKGVDINGVDIKNVSITTDEFGDNTVMGKSNTTSDLFKERQTDEFLYYYVFLRNKYLYSNEHIIEAIFN